MPIFKVLATFEAPEPKNAKFLRKSPHSCYNLLKTLYLYSIQFDPDEVIVLRVCPTVRKPFRSGAS